MNWDRVQKENLARDHGSEWADPPEVIPPNDWANGRLAKKESPPGKPRKPRYKVTISVANGMVGCTCGKPVGFTGAHRKRCPRSRFQSSSLRQPVRL